MCTLTPLPPTHTRTLALQVVQNWVLAAWSNATAAAIAQDATSMAAAAALAVNSTTGMWANATGANSTAGLWANATGSWVNATGANSTASWVNATGSSAAALGELASSAISHVHQG